MRNHPFVEGTDRWYFGWVFMRHVIDLLDWDGSRLLKLLQEAARLKKAHQRRRGKPILRGKVLGMIFEKPSLRTRVSFEAGMAQLGGTTIFLGQQEAGLGQRESIADFARTVSQYVDAVVLRTFRHATVEEFAGSATIPVINGLSDYYHPCQALGDLLTMEECCGGLAGKQVVFVGDGNNVARSLAIVCAKVDARFQLVAPRGYGFDQDFVKLYQREFGAKPREETEVRKAVPDADILYTDVWASMGQEDQAAQRQKAFARHQVNADLLKLASPHVKVMHCLPARRGEEITDEVLDGPASIAFAQAGNRMHAQKALLAWVLGK